MSVHHFQDRSGLIASTAETTAKTTVQISSQATGRSRGHGSRAVNLDGHQGSHQHSYQMLQSIPPQASLVAIDRRVQGAASLAAGVAPGWRVLLLEPTERAFAQITQALEALPTQHLHLVAHGEPGWLQLGRAGVSANSIAQGDRSWLQRWAALLGDRAEILLYGCRSGAGELGQQLIQAIAQVTNTTVAAATAPIGSAQRGGVWRLDRSTGPISAPLPFTDRAIAQYPGLLNPNFPNCIPNQFLGIANFDNFPASPPASPQQAQNDLVVVDLATGEVRLQQANFIASDAIAREPGTNRIYALPTSGGDIQVTDLGGKPGDSVPNSKPSGRLAFDLAGNIIAGLGRQIDFINNKDNEDKGKITKSFTISSITGSTDDRDLPPMQGVTGAMTGDFAFDPSDGSLLIVLRSPAPGSGNGRVYKVPASELAKGSPDGATVPIEAQLLGNIKDGAPFSGLAFGYDGNLYATTTNADDKLRGGGLYRIDKNSGVATPVARTIIPKGTIVNGVALADDQAIAVGDLATLPSQPVQPNLSLTKTDGLTTVIPGSTVTYTITVSNTGACNIAAPFLLNLSDALPAELQNPTWDRSLDPFPLGVGDTKTFKVSGKIADLATGTITNTARLSLPTGIFDPDLGPLQPQVLTATDTTQVLGAINTPPTPRNLVLTYNPNGSIPLAAIDPDSDPITEFVITDIPAGGSLFLLDPLTGAKISVLPGQSIPPGNIGNLRFESPTGRGSFKYAARDNKGNLSPDSATVLFDKAEIVADPPVPLNAIFNVVPGSATDLTEPPEGGIAKFRLGGLPPTAVDPNGDPIGSYVITQIPNLGDLFVGDPFNGGRKITSAGPLTPAEFGNLFYVPRADFTGKDFLTFDVIDSKGNRSLIGGTISFIAPPGVSVASTPPTPPTSINNSLGGIPFFINSITDVTGAALNCGCQVPPLAASWQIPNPLIVPELPALVIPPPPETGDSRFLGTLGNDDLAGSAGNDFITGFGGNDRLRGGPGSDEAIGDVGNDSIFGGLGNSAAVGPGVDADRLGGGDGNDLLNGNEGEDAIFGGNGSDVINGGKDNDILLGDRGSDVIRGDQGADTIIGGLGRPDNRPDPTDRDLIFGNTENDVISANEGEDTVFGGQGDDYIRGGKEADLLFGDRGSDILIGDLGDDTIVGGTGVRTITDPGGNDLLFGLGGNDLLFGNEGNDTVSGGEGNDRAFGGQNNDLLLGDGGNDTLYGDLGNDTILGSGGSDVSIGRGGDDDLLYGGRGQDNINGGQGQDTIYAGQDDDLVYGGKDDDLLYGDKGSDVLSGDLGNDTLIGGNGNSRDPDRTGNDVLLGGGNEDLLLGNDGNDSLSGEDGNDTARGGQGNDYLWGGAGIDLLLGDRGNDTLCGEDGNDTLYGNNPDRPQTVGVGTDNDVLAGNAGNDLLYGNDGEDQLDGCEDNDTLVGGKGNDTLLGSSGNDVLSGDLGDDLLSGGDGVDTFVIGQNRGVDTITDYFGNNDRIALADGLRFADLNFAEVEGSIDIRVGTQTIARLQGIPALQFVNGQDFFTL